MHAVIINGSPRAQKLSNTEKIIDAFAKGLAEEGTTSERYAISNKGSWDAARNAFAQNTEIIFALPLFVECVPGLMLEFLETLPEKDKNTRISFILQGGFAEASQLSCGKAYLETLPAKLGASYGGTLIKGDNFGIRVASEEDVKKLTDPYREMGKVFAAENGFSEETVSRFAGPEYFPLPTRLMLQVVFMTIAKKRFDEAAKKWGCTRPLDYKAF